MFKLVRKTKGNVLLQVLVATAAMGISFYYLTNYVLGQKDQVGKTINAVNLRFALNSATDYILFGVRQKYCFTDDDLLLNDVATKCDLTHTGSIERLIMSVEQENYIRHLIDNGSNVGPVDKNSIRINKISRFVAVDSVTTAHPLFAVLKGLKKIKTMDGKIVSVAGISITLERVDDVFLPRSGREVYLKAKLDLKASKNDSNPIYFGKTPLTVTSQIAIYPREVGSFALLVPNDLHLDKSWDETMSSGDFSLNKFSSRKEVTNSAGLVFLSPVFVNRDIHLPVDQADTVSPDSVNYTPVTFADRVYIGNGWVKSNGKNYVPRTSGLNSDRQWSDVRTFGGFLKGIEIDGGTDLGLQYLAKIASGALPSTDLMAQCAQRANSLASASILAQSDLGLKVLSNDTNAPKYQMFLNNGNNFSGQHITLAINQLKWGAGKADYNLGKYASSSAYVNLSFTVGDKVVEAPMPKSGSLILYPEVGSDALLEKYNTAITTASATYDKISGNIDDLQKQLTDAKALLSKLQDDLAAEQSKKTPDDTVIADLQAKITDAQKQIDTLNAAITDQTDAMAKASSDLDKAKQALADYQAKVSNPPKIVISTVPVKKGSREYKDRLELDVTFQNVENMIDKDGKYAKPELKIQAYDSTFYNGMPYGNSNSNLLGYLNFGFNFDYTQIIAPTLLSRTSSGSTVTVADSSVDTLTLDEICEAARSSVSSQSFGGAGWDVSFASGSRVSWNFASGSSTTPVGKDPVLDKLELFNSTRDTAVFQVRSIVGKCIIDKTSDFITGFYTCDSLEISERSTPLRIIGTFIVAQSLKIHPSAFKAGITWSSIYHPQVTNELRSNQILRSFSGRSCYDLGGDPIWHPIPSVQTASDRFKCNTISLRAQADPFQWTSVDPDCGIDPAKPSSTTSCKRRLIRFFVVEQSREGL
ncbi:MAG: hypothetical protein ACXVCP_14780 [Bdellovibrio sp.]